jgi:hypothetical protein
MSRPRWRQVQFQVAYGNRDSQGKCEKEPDEASQKPAAVVTAIRKLLALDKK